MPELQDSVNTASRVRCIGSAHSFTPLIGTVNDPPTQLLSLRKMPRIAKLDVDRKTITIDAGMTYSEVSHYLTSHPSSNLAMPNTCSLPHFSVAGAVATGSHGSSGLGADGRLKLSGMADAVIAITIVGVDGEPRTLRKKVDEEFDFAVVSLGMLGVVTQLTLQLVDGYDVRKRVYGSWPPQDGLGGSYVEKGGLEKLLASLPEALRSTDSVSAFVQWSVDDVGMLILRDKIQQGSPPLPPPAMEWQSTGAQLRHQPIDGFLEGFGAFDATSTGPWCDKMHIWMKDARPFGPQGSPELQLEHFVPLRHAAEALERTRLVGAAWGSSLLYAEVRAVRGDEQALSPYTCDEEEGYDTIAITNGLCGSLGEERVMRAAAVLEDALKPLRARPHWGKLFSYSPEQLEDIYGDRLLRFRSLVQRVDPEGKFRNNWLNRVVMGG